MEPMFCCAGCGATLPPSSLPFGCPGSRPGDDIDHVLTRIDAAPKEPVVGEAQRGETAGADALERNPFVRYRHRLSSYALAAAHGLSDAEFIRLVRELDDAVRRVDGAGFTETPFMPQPALAARLGFEEPGSLLVKDETGNVSGSHKARHLMGVLIYLQVAVRLGMLRDRPQLAIASCGNAALAAGVVAAAAGWPLEVFVPPTAPAAVLSRLTELGAVVHTCSRRPGIAGDPCYSAFRAAVADGVIPFCCQGSDNALTIEGGQTIAWEMALPLDAVFVQVGGGALASAVVQGFHDDRQGFPRVPAVYTVQTAGGYPLARAYDRLVARMLGQWQERDEPAAESPEALARALACLPAALQEALGYARHHRSGFMWPWEEEPRSIAHGILDDETYDWAAVVEGMLRSAGRPLVVGEERLRNTNRLASELTGTDADHTGTAGLAGLAQALEQEPDLRYARVAVVFTGRRRS